jgi:hypothetical protein
MAPRGLIIIQVFEFFAGLRNPSKKDEQPIISCLRK